MSRSLFNFLFAKPITYLATHLVGTAKGQAVASKVNAAIAPAVQTFLDSQKPRIEGAISGEADKLVAEMSQPDFDATVIRPRLHAALSELHLGNVVQGIVEAEIYAVALPQGEALTKQGLYAAVAQINARVAAL